MSQPPENPLIAILHWCQRHRTRLSWTLVALAVIITVVLGTIGFKGLNEQLPLSTNIYLAVQLLTLESGALGDQETISWTLELARWSGLVAFLGAIVNTLLAVFAQRIHQFLLRRMTHHAVIIGSGRAGTQLATDLLGEGHRVIIIEIDENNSAMPTLIERGAHEVVGDARQTETLAAAAVENADILVIVAGSDTRNLEILHAVEEACKHRNPQASPLRCYLHIVDERLSHLRKGTPGSETHHPGMEISTFNRFSNSARLLLDTAPLDRQTIAAADQRQVHLVIVEMNPLGEALLRQALAIGHFANQLPLAVTVIDDSASGKEENLLVRIPELHQCGELTFIDGCLHQATVQKRLEQLLADTQQIVSIAVCHEDSQAALVGCLDLVPLLTDFNNTLYVNLGKDDSAAVMLNVSEAKTVRLVSFGNTDAACSSRAILRRELDLLARKIHDDYRAKRAADGDSEQEYPAMRPWEQLDGQVRDMNRQQADHIAVKLRALGCGIVPDSSGDAAAFQMSDNEIEALAITEHQRWAASRRLSGWRQGATRDNTNKLHPDLVPWEDLDEATREYDREPVRNLPSLLATIGYSIQRQKD